MRTGMRKSPRASRDGFEVVARCLVYRAHDDAGQRAARFVGDRAAQRGLLREGRSRKREHDGDDQPSRERS